jgi:hypothetical protein
MQCCCGELVEEAISIGRILNPASILEKFEKKEIIVSFREIASSSLLA